MWELLSQKIKSEKLRPGDHIYTWRLLHTYSHHGIYVGDDKVIHFVNQNEERDMSRRVRGSIGSNISSSSSTRECSGHRCPQNENAVLLTCLDCFLNGGSLYRYMYGENIGFIFFKLRGGTCTSASSDPEKEVVDRAYYLHQNGYGEYNLMENNCEDFALYCKTGLMSTDPTKQGRSGQVHTVHGQDDSHSSLVKAIDWRVTNDLGYRKDVTKVKVEELAAFLRQLKEKVN